MWPLERVTAALADLAEAALGLAVAHLLRAAHDAGELRLPDPDDPARGGGFTVLGMGKLGARELNYSSAIWTSCCCTTRPRRYTPNGPTAMPWRGFTAAFARGLVALMEARDADGYVFRTDLRLRPDPAATPPAVALTGAITYYESMGQNWERAAMIKARPVAGDLALGAAFLEAIRPFVWRRGLDFAAVADIHAMKRRIDAHKGGALAGGSRPGRAHRRPQREAGRGRHPGDRVPGADAATGLGRARSGTARPTTLGALRLLAGPATCRARAAAELAAAYRFLRQVEHRLQMVADRQVHALPERPAELARFATFMGYRRTPPRSPRRCCASSTGCGPATPRCSSRSRECGRPSGGAGAGFPRRRCGAGGDGGGAARPGVRESGRIVAAVRGWQAGRVRALRSERARELMGRMLPALLAALARQPHPDAAFSRFDAFLGAAAGGRAVAVAVPAQSGAAGAGGRGAGRGAVAGRASGAASGGAGGVAVAARRTPRPGAVAAQPADAMRGGWRT